MGKRVRLVGCVPVIILLGIYFLACSYLQCVSIKRAGLLFVFYGVCVFSVGYAAINLFRIELDHTIERIAVSYAIGYAVMIGIYLIVFPLFGKNFLSMAVWAIGIVSFIISGFFLIKVDRPDNLTKKEWIIAGTVLVVTLAMQFFLYAVNNVSALRTGHNSYYVDLLYWASDATSMTKQFPPINFRDYFAGGTYHYHYFSSIQTAVTSMCTGIPVYSIILGFSFIQGTIILVLSGFCFYKRVVKKPFYICVGLLLLLMTTGYEATTNVSIVSHLFTAPFGNDMALAFSMLVYILFIDHIDGNKKGVRYTVLILAGYVTCIGIKGPVGQILMVICGLMCIYGLFSPDKKKRRMTFLYGVCFVLLFVLIYLFVINGLPGASSRTGYFIQDGTENTILNLPELKKIYISLDKKYGIIIANILFFLLFTIRISPAVFIPFLIFLLLKILLRRELKPAIDLPVIGVMMGIMENRYIKMVGFSQMYFTIAILPFAVAFTIHYFEEWSLEVGKKKKVYQNGITFSCIVFLLVGSGLFLDSKSFYPQITSGLRKAFNICHLKENEEAYLLYKNGNIIVTDLGDPEKYEGGYLVITGDMLEACRWISAFTDEDALIASNVMLPIEYQYPIGVFSNRWIWTNKTSWLDNALEGRRSSLYRLLMDGVSYIVTEKPLEGIEEEPLLNLETVYENQTIAVLRISEKLTE